MLVVVVLVVFGVQSFVRLLPRRLRCHMGGSHKVWSLFGYPKYWVPYYLMAAANAADPNTESKRRQRDP